MHHPCRRNVTTAMIWAKNNSRISPKMVNPRDVAGNAEEEEKEEEEEEEEEEDDDDEQNRYFGSW